MKDFIEYHYANSSTDNVKSMTSNLKLIPGDHKELLNILLERYIANVPINDIYFII